jgi:hypothetical protein
MGGELMKMALTTGSDEIVGDLTGAKVDFSEWFAVVIMTQ